ncbi:hypothetical protein NL676_036280 [Syzygium grande]|nr:hypothetical protein NL676_036280 [Syzygium grande]
MNRKKWAEFNESPPDDFNEELGIIRGLRSLLEIGLEIGDQGGPCCSSVAAMSRHAFAGVAAVSRLLPLLFWYPSLPLLGLFSLRPEVSDTLNLSRTLGSIRLV